MPKYEKGPRVDWCPGPAAIEALAIGEDLCPGRSRQNLIDLLVITGVSAMLASPWRPPSFPAGSRYRWRLPADLAGKATPEDRSR